MQLQFLLKIFLIELPRCPQIHTYFHFRTKIWKHKLKKKGQQGIEKTEEGTRNQELISLGIIISKLSPSCHPCER